MYIRGEKALMFSLPLSSHSPPTAVSFSFFFLNPFLLPPTVSYNQTLPRPLISVSLYLPALPHVPHLPCVLLLTPSLHLPTLLLNPSLLPACLPACFIHSTLHVILSSLLLFHRVHSALPTLWTRMLLTSHPSAPSLISLTPIFNPFSRKSPCAVVLVPPPPSLSSPLPSPPPLPPSSLHLQL